MIKAQDHPYLLVGKIFETTWGYDQTNVNFVKVLSVSASGKTARCMMMSHKEVEDDRFIPDREWGEPFKMLVKVYNGSFSLRGSYPYCDGDTRLSSFSLWSGKPIYKTPWNMGH